MEIIDFIPYSSVIELEKLKEWENSLQLQRRVRDQNGNWTTQQEIALARPILEKLFIRLPYLFRLMKEEE